MGRAGPCSLGWIGLTGREWAPTDYDTGDAGRRLRAGNRLLLDAVRKAAAQNSNSPERSTAVEERESR